MPATTPKGFPYPLGSDPLNAGDDAIAALASKLDEVLGASCSGVVSIPITAVNTNASVAVTFPVGVFLTSGQPPHAVLVTARANAPATLKVSAGTATWTGCILYGSRSSGNQPFNAEWEAVRI